MEEIDISDFIKEKKNEEKIEPDQSLSKEFVKLLYNFIEEAKKLYIPVFNHLYLNLTNYHEENPTIYDFKCLSGIELVIERDSRLFKLLTYSLKDTGRGNSTKVIFNLVPNYQEIISIDELEKNIEKLELLDKQLSMMCYDQLKNLDYFNEFQWLLDSLYIDLLNFLKNSIGKKSKKILKIFIPSRKCRSGKIIGISEVKPGKIKVDTSDGQTCSILLDQNIQRLTVLRNIYERYIRH